VGIDHGRLHQRSGRTRGTGCCGPRWPAPSTERTALMAEPAGSGEQHCGPAPPDSCQEASCLSLAPGPRRVMASARHCGMPQTWAAPRRGRPRAGSSPAAARSPSSTGIRFDRTAAHQPVPGGFAGANLRSPARTVSWAAVCWESARTVDLARLGVERDHHSRVAGRHRSSRRGHHSSQPGQVPARPGNPPPRRAVLGTRPPARSRGRRTARPVSLLHAGFMETTAILGVADRHG